MTATELKSVMKTSKFEYNEDTSELQFTTDSKTMDALVKRKTPLKHGEYEVHVDFDGETEDGEPELVVTFSHKKDGTEYGENVPVADIKDKFWKSIAKAGLRAAQQSEIDWDEIFPGPTEWPIEIAIKAGAFTEEELATIKKIMFAAIGRMPPEQQKKLADF